MLRVVGDTPLYIDCDPFAKTISWSKTSANGCLTGTITSLGVDQAELFVSDLRCCVNDLDEGEDHPPMSVPGPVSLFVEAEAQAGWISFSALETDGKLAGDITLVDAVQAEHFVALLQRGIAVCKTGIGGLDMFGMA